MVVVVSGGGTHPALKPSPRVGEPVPHTWADQRPRPTRPINHREAGARLKLCGPPCLLHARRTGLDAGAPRLPLSPCAALPAVQLDVLAAFSA